MGKDNNPQIGARKSNSRDSLVAHVGFLMILVQQQCWQPSDDTSKEGHHAGHIFNRHHDSDSDRRLF